ncbi:T9SS type B sorting domain-containing protein [Mariniflexile sp.]|uniref:T9SS type B sorting domain-containing protein n=1 Tax=Mariniflexile sp. TaxID=1979402 RepID=UPI00356362D4
MRKFLILGLLFAWFFQVHAQEPNDCVDAVTVCGNGNFSSNASGIGNSQEISSCGGFEHNSFWLKVDIVQAGTLGFNLIPADTDINVDYDFWVFGPNRVCNNLGSPIRCSTTHPVSAGLSSNVTGINGSTTVTQSGPGANGNGFVYWLNVKVGESYYIAIDRPVGDGGFEIEWTGTATAGTGAFPAPPEAKEIDDLVACSNNSNVSIFDLNSVKSAINSDTVNNTIEFYENLADAVDGINPLPGIYANKSNPQQIYAKVKTGSTECYSLVDFNLVVSGIPKATVSVSDTSVCTNEAVTYTISGTPGATIEYNLNGNVTQEVLLDASGLATISETLTATSTFNLTKAKVLNSSGVIVCSENIAESVTTSVNGNTAPTITNNTPVCEGETGLLEFVGEPNATITYHIGSNPSTTFNLDASGNYSLSLPGLITTTDVTIESVTSSVSPFCVMQIDSIETIVVNSAPIITNPDPLYECNNGTNPNSASFDLDSQKAIITNNDTSLTVTFYETLALAQNGDANDVLVSPYASTSANQTLHVRVENTLGCTTYTTLNLQVIDAPFANAIPALQECDINNLGFATFDLTQASASIVAGNTQPVDVTYHISFAEAENGTPSITSPNAFQNTDPYNQTLYVRVSSQATKCYDVVALNLEVFDTPVINTVAPYILCDDDQDGYVIFDLSSLNSTIIGSQVASDYNISFYESQANANQPTSPITNPSAYQNTVVGTQTLWVRLENITTACFDVASFEIRTDIPLVLDSSYTASVCDSDGDGEYTFNLTDYSANILSNATDSSIYNVDFYPSLQNAIDDVAIIANPQSYTSQSNPQTTLGVRVTSTQSSCFSTAELVLDITVLPDPSTIVLNPLITCDNVTVNDGLEIFDLTQVESIIGSGVSNLSFSYHNSQNDATSGNSPISSPNNYTSASTNVFIRVTSANANNAACYAIFPLELIVNPVPTIVSSKLSVCSPNSNGYYSFDLDAEIAAILGVSQSSIDYTVVFFEDAATTNEITTNPYTNTQAYTQTIYTKITNNVTGCSSTFPFELVVELAATATQPAAVEVCDNDGANDGFNTFDLTTLTAEVLDGQDPGVFSLSFHLTNQEAIDGINPINNPENFSNTIQYNQTVYIRVSNRNVSNGCFAVTSFDFTVKPILKPEISSLYGLNTLCVDFETQTLQNEITLISSFQGSNYLYTWYLNGTEISGANQGEYIIDTVAPGLYTLSVTELQSTLNCKSEISEAFEVIQSGKAVFIDLAQSSAFDSPQTITINVEGYGDYFFQLDNGPILDNDGVFTNVSTGVHTVYVHDTKTNLPSCGSIAIEDITVIGFPKFLTPNNDGYNDTWNVFALNDQPNASITIYNRYGKVLTQIKPNGPGWDGTYNGEVLPSTDYWFVLTYEESGEQKQYRSHFSLKR